MAEQVDDDLCIASLTVAEIHRGILEKPAGQKRAALEAWFSGNEGPQSLFAGSILPADEKAALIWGELIGHGNRPPSECLGHNRGCDCAIPQLLPVTDNERDFQGIDIINSPRASVI